MVFLLRPYKRPATVVSTHPEKSANFVFTQAVKKELAERSEDRQGKEAGPGETPDHEPAAETGPPFLLGGLDQESKQADVNGSHQKKNQNDCGRAKTGGVKDRGSGERRLPIGN